MYLSTLFVVINVSARKNIVCALNFEQDKLLQFSISNSKSGADGIAYNLCDLLSKSSFSLVVIVLESTSFYGTHITNFYYRKFDEVTTHQHKRALALTSQKFIHLVFGLLAKNQLFVSQRVDFTPNS